MHIPDKELCEERVKKYKNDDSARQAYEYYAEWLYFHNGGEAPTMIPISTMIAQEEEIEQYATLTHESIKQILSFLPYFIERNNLNDNKVSEFVKILYASNFIINFDWVKWNDGEKIISDERLIKVSDLLTLRKLMTVIVRKDRFCEGILWSAIENGTIKFILERLKIIHL